MTASIRPHEDIAYVRNSDAPSLFLGLVINPVKGAWMTFTGDCEEVEHAHYYGSRLAAADFTSGGEYEIQDVENFPIRPSTLEEAGVLAELWASLDDEKYEALAVWAAHIGHRYALYESGKLRSAHDIESAFEDDFRGVYDGVKAFGTEALEEELSAHDLPENVKNVIHNWLDVEAYAEGDLSGDCYWGPIDGGRIAVFWRS